jgi:hypothetical protein
MLRSKSYSEIADARRISKIYMEDNGLGLSLAVIV